MPQPMSGPFPHRMGRGGAVLSPVEAVSMGRDGLQPSRLHEVISFFFPPSSNRPTGSIEQSAVFWFVLLFLLHFFSPLILDVRLHVG